MGSQHGFANALGHPDEGNPFRSHTMPENLKKYVNTPKHVIPVEKSQGDVQSTKTAKSEHPPVPKGTRPKGGY